MDITNKIFARIYINIALISVAITAFFFIAGARPVALQHTLFTLQLVLSTPLLLSSTLLLGKATSVKRQHDFVDAAQTFFLLGYAMLVNSIGIFIGEITGAAVAFMFFFAHIVSTLLYSYLVIRKEGDSIAHRAKKDIPFILIIIFFGVLAVLGST